MSDTPKYPGTSPLQGPPSVSRSAGSYRLRPDTWVQTVVEEMKANGFRLLSILKNGPEGPSVKVTFAKAGARGTAEGGREAYSVLIVRAAIAAYESENGEEPAWAGESPVPVP